MQKGKKEVAYGIEYIGIPTTFKVKEASKLSIEQITKILEKRQNEHSSTGK